MPRKLPKRDTFDNALYGAARAFNQLHFSRRIRYVIIAIFLLIAAALSVIYGTDSTNPLPDFPDDVPQVSENAVANGFPTHNIRNGTDHVFEFANLSPEQSAALTTVLNFLSAQIPVKERPDGTRVGFSWRHAQPDEEAEYTAISSDYCGEGPAACAFTIFTHGWIIFDPDYDFIPNTLVMELHELLHLVANLQHVPNGAPGPSVMTPTMNSTTGYSLSVPPATGLVSNDLDQILTAIDYPVR